MVNPLPAAANPTAGDIARGRVYYTYYCIQCHGGRGDGTGPVGESLFPPPADLRSPRAQARSDDQLLRAMLTGPSHEPVLEYTVLPEHRWWLVLYVRALAEVGSRQPAVGNRSGGP